MPCNCGVQTHNLCLVCGQEFHQYKFSLDYAYLPDDPAIRICGSCHRARNRYEELRAVFRAQQRQEPYQYIQEFPQYPYNRMPESERSSFTFIHNGQNRNYGDRVDVYERCAQCHNFFEPYITPKPVPIYLAQDAIFPSLKILQSFQFCRDCHEEYRIEMQRSTNLSQPIKEFLGLDPDWLLRSLDISSRLTYDDDNRGRRVVHNYLIPYSLNATKAKDTQGLIPQYYEGPKCSHSVSKWYCYFCAFKRNAEPINPQLFQLFIEHSFGDRLSAILNFFEQDEMANPDKNKCVKISKEFLQNVFDHYTHGITVLKRWEKLPDIFVGIFQKYHLRKFDHTLIQYFVKFRIEPLYTDTSIRNAITYFIGSRTTVKKTLAQRATESIRWFGNLNRWREERYRERLNKTLQIQTEYAKFYNTHTLCIKDKTRDYVTERYYICSELRRGRFIISIMYHPYNKQLSIIQVDKKEGKPEEVPYISQALCLYFLADILNRDIEIKEIRQEEIVNPTTLSICNPKTVYSSVYTTKVNLHQERRLMRPVYRQTIALSTPNFRNSLDLARYLQDLSRGTEIPLPPYFIDYMYSEQNDDIYGSLKFIDPIVVHKNSIPILDQTTGQIMGFRERNVPIGYIQTAQTYPLQSAPSPSSPQVSKK